MEEQIKNRTKPLGISVIKLVDLLPNKTSSHIIVRQIVRSAISIGANYRAACREKSVPGFIYKLKIVEEETDETVFWIEILEDSGILKSTEIAVIKKECNELLSIIVASIKTLRAKSYHT